VLESGAEMKIQITIRGRLIVTPDHPGEAVDHDAEIERVFDETMAELVALACIDPSVTGSIATGEIEISVVAETPGDDLTQFRAAIDKADTCIQLALQVARVGTPDWKDQQVTIEIDNIEADRILIS
jgi:hypothetical protein